MIYARNQGETIKVFVQFIKYIINEYVLNKMKVKIKFDKDTSLDKYIIFYKNLNINIFKNISKINKTCKFIKHLVKHSLFLTYKLKTYFYIRINSFVH